MHGVKKILHGPAQVWLKRHPVHEKAAGPTSDQGTYLGYGFSPSQGAYERQIINVSLSQP